jgi:hypothetical protein
VLVNFGTQLALTDLGNNGLGNKRRDISDTSLTTQRQYQPDVTNLDFELVLECAQKLQDVIVAFRCATNVGDRQRYE